MVVQSQNGKHYFSGFSQACIVTAEIPEKAKTKKEKDTLRNNVVAVNDPDQIVYEVSAGSKIGGIYTGKTQAEKICQEFNAAMKSGAASYTFPEDNPVKVKRGIFKA